MVFSFTRQHFWCASLLAVLVGAGSPTLAQDTDKTRPLAAVEPTDDESADIIVTATRRPERLQDVPVAVSVVDGDRLRTGNLNNLRDIASEIPSLNFRTAASNKDQALFVRGLGTVSTSPGVEPSVSTVLDGVVLARQGQATLDLLDIDHIEVLRGPQGTLFGKNASAGVLNIVTRKPGDAFRGFVDVSGFEGGEGRIRLAASGPVTDNVSVGFSALGTQFKGNVRNVFDGERVDGYTKAGTRSVRACGHY